MLDDWCMDNVLRWDKTLFSVYNTSSLIHSSLTSSYKHKDKSKWLSATLRYIYIYKYTRLTLSSMIKRLLYISSHQNVHHFHLNNYVTRFFRKLHPFCSLTIRSYIKNISICFDHKCVHSIFWYTVIVNFVHFPILTQFSNALSWENVLLILLMAYVFILCNWLNNKKHLRFDFSWLTPKLIVQWESIFRICIISCFV